MIKTAITKIQQDCRCNDLGSKSQENTRVYRATFARVGCFYLFLNLRHKCVTSFLAGAISPKNQAPQILKIQAADVMLLPLESPLNTRAFGADFEGGGHVYLPPRFSGVKASHIHIPLLQQSAPLLPLCAVSFSVISLHLLP